MRAEQCEVTTDAAGRPLRVVWDGLTYEVDSAKRTHYANDQLSFREYWALHSGKTLLKIHSVEYGSPGHQTGKWWWISGISPNPRGIIAWR